MADPARSDRLLKQITDFVATNKFQGVTIDFEFEQAPPGLHKDLQAFLSRLSAAFAPHDWIIAQAAPFDDDQWPKIRQVLDGYRQLIPNNREVDQTP